MSYSSLFKNNNNNFTNYLCKSENNMILSSFFLKTNAKTITTLRNNLTLSMKNISYFYKNETALLLLFKFADNDSLIYGRWFNYSNQIDKEILEIMLFQKEIPIVLIDSSTNENFTFYAPNDFSTGIKEHIKKANNHFMNNDDFKLFVDKLEKNTDCLSKLWNSIEA